MALSPEEVLAVLDLMTVEQVQQLREKVAPATKVSRLLEEATRLLSDTNAGAARARAVIQPVIEALNRGDDKVAVPVWDDVVKAFDGR